MTESTKIVGLSSGTIMELFRTLKLVKPVFQFCTKYISDYIRDYSDVKGALYFICGMIFNTIKVIF